MELRLKWIKLKKDITRVSRELEINIENINSIIDKEKEENERIKRNLRKVFNDDR